jgi:SAM-dependent methyltransferase
MAGLDHDAARLAEGPGRILTVQSMWYRNTEMLVMRRFLVALAVCAGWLVVAGQPNTTFAQAPKPATEKPAAPPRQPDVVYVPTPQGVVDKMLELAEVKKGDVVYDLGCGDGRILVTAAKKFGVKAVGFDINPERVKESLENVRTNKVGHLVTIKQADIFTLDLQEASVVTLYLLPELNVRLMPQLEKLKPGSRIVSHDFDMRGAKPVVTHKFNVDTAGKSSDEGFEEFAHEHTIYKWVVPWEKEPAEPTKRPSSSAGP